MKQLLKQIFLGLFLVFGVFVSPAQVSPNASKQASKKTASAASEKGVANDSNTPLHLLKPDYGFHYGELKVDEVKADIDRVYHYLNSVTPTEVVDSRTQNVLTDFTQIDRYSQLKRGDFRLASYEWGVTYAGMLRLSEVTNEKQYSDYVFNRFNFLAEVAPHFRKVLTDVGEVEPQMRQILKPHALDDAGAVCAAMIKASTLDPKSEAFRPLIDNYMNYIMYHEYRLADGTFARNRPHHNTVWLDDMYMSIPAIVQMGKLTGEQKYFNEAAKQIKQFKDRMFVPEKNLFRHGWVEGMSKNPAFFWGRANGWALLTLCEVLDVLPRSHPSYPEIMDLLQRHIEGLATLQSGQGFWHQLLDRNDSYLETSATAIYVYGIAHAINKGWIDGMVYGPVAQLGWEAVSTQINEKGQVEGTCVGTGMAFDPAFYCYRPVSHFAAHGYGPVLLAGAEMMQLLQTWNPKMNDSGIQYYRTAQETSEPIFSVQDASRPAVLKAGSTRKGKKPVLFLIGDSTVKNGKGKGDGGQWGWGSFFDLFLDTTQISVENHALGGRSSRTFITEGLWNAVLPGLREGDYLMIQFGHNDGGPLNTGRARASLKGVGNEQETVLMERHGGPETVYTYGHYMRQYIRQAKAHGVHVIVLSHTPGNRWTGDRMNRCTDTYAAWSKQVAEEEGVHYIDLNDRAATKYEALGIEDSKAYFKDNVHTSFEGAILNGKALIEGVNALENCNLKDFVKPSALSFNMKQANKPLFRDPVFDGAADPVVIWNEAEKRWFMFYTNRRASMVKNSGVEWVHGTPIGIAESTDGGATWNYRGVANISYGGNNITYWAPDVLEDNGLYHMFLTVVPGIFADWSHPREIVHLTSKNLIDWEFHSKVPLASDKVIDAGVVKAPNGQWRMYYNNERDRKSIYYAESDDLFTWADKGKAVGDRSGEGPKVFAWKGKYFMIVDNWNGLAVYQSDDMQQWKRQENNILGEGGTGADDQTNGLHADVVVNNDRAYIFYFTHPGRLGEAGKKDSYETRRSSIQVAELEYVNGQIVCDRNKPVLINLQP